MSEKQEFVMTGSANQKFTHHNAGDDLANRLSLEAVKQGKEPGFLTVQYLDGRETSCTVKPQ